jgi:hypothetical protein
MRLTKMKECRAQSLPTESVLMDDYICGAVGSVRRQEFGCRRTKLPRYVIVCFFTAN